MENIDANTLLVLIAGALALLFDYFPVLSEKFDALDISQKKLIVVGLSALAAGVVFAGQCNGFFQTNLVCEPKSIVDLLYSVIVAVSVNYGFHKATKPSLG
jgi:hypothetical protein